MESYMDLKILDKICQQCNLGIIESKPLPLKGGFMHKMYSLFTTKGKYAVKLLNPYVMQRKTAMDNFHNAERLELILEQNNIPVIPALTFNGKKMQKIDGQFYYLYEWYNGKALRSEEIREIHCRKIGNVLAKIHRLDRKEASPICDEMNIEWDYYIEQLGTKNRELYHLLNENRTLLYESQKNRNSAIKKLPSIEVICHNDMDSKNVLWIEEECRVIDLECLSYSNPFMELYELALCWSGYEKCDIDYNLLKLFIRSYAEAGGQIPVDWETVYDSNHGRLEWLEYNVKRSLGIECSEDEIDVGFSEVKETMNHMLYYHEARNKIIDCLKQI